MQIQRFSIETNQPVELLPFTDAVCNLISFNNGKRSIAEVRADLEAGYAVYTSFSFFMLASPR